MLLAPNVTLAADQAPQSPFPPRMRGMNTPIHGLEKDTEITIARLAKWGVNTLRINFGQDSRGHREITPDPPTKENPLAPYRRNLKILDRVLASCAKHHIGVILAAADIYGRKLDVFWQKTEGLENREHLMAFWDAMTPIYKDNPTVIAFELLNEPNFKPGEEDIWRKTMQPQALAMVRKYTKTKWVVVQPGPWGHVQAYANYKPVNDSHVIYTYHYYTPQCYTHQGIWKKYKRGRNYPGTYHEFANPKGVKKYWSIDSVRADAKIVKSFCDKYKVRMFVGEFSVIRWAPHGAQYLANLIRVFEENGFGWLYHSVGGYNGWNLTFDANDPVNSEVYGGKVTDRLKVLLKGWKLNSQ